MRMKWAKGFPGTAAFLKPSTSVIACGEAVIYPEISHRLDYEGELAVVIGKRAHNVQKRQLSRVHFRLYLP